MGTISSFEGFDVTTGPDPVATATRILTSGTVRYVHHTGSNANAGLDPDTPFATLGAAITASATGDTVVLLEGHAEAITAAITTGAKSRLTIVGLGVTEDGEPSVVLTPNLTNPAVVPLTLTGNFSELRNIKFAAAQQRTTVATVVSSMSHGRIANCVFEGGVNNEYQLLKPGSWERVENVIFRSLATSLSTRPRGAIFGTATSLTLRSVTLDGGEFGWVVPAISSEAPDGNGISNLAGDGLTLVNSPILFNESTDGWIQLVSRDSKSKVSWSALVQTNDYLRHLPRGFEVTGDCALVAPNGEFFSNKPVVWAHVGTGNDANAGTAKRRPKKTLAAAVTAAGTAGLVVLLPGHEETLTSRVDLSAVGVTVVGLGRAGGRPTCTLTRTSGVDGTLNIDGDTVRVYNLMFPATGSTSEDYLVNFEGDNGMLCGCLLEAAAPLSHGAIRLSYTNSLGAVMRDVTVVSAATSAATVAVSAIRGNTVNYAEDMLFDNVVIDCREFGFSSHAFSFIGLPAGHIRAINLNLLNGADVNIGPGISYGFITLGTVTGGGNVVWDTVA